MSHRRSAVWKEGEFHDVAFDEVSRAKRKRRKIPARCSPSPPPSPPGRGGIVFRLLEILWCLNTPRLFLANNERAEATKHALEFATNIDSRSLSPRERVR